MSETRFTNEYESPTDYILGITDRIWKGRDIGLIRRCYAKDVRVHTAAGTAGGVDAVVAGTLETLHLFPDRRLLGEDVIWSDGGPGCAYSSHRIASTMHHRGDGRFGAPTGRPVHARTIADCLVRDGRICEEWLVRDQAAIALQLGLSPAELGARLAGEQGPSADDHTGLRDWEAVREASGVRSVLDGSAGSQCATAMSRLWNDTELAHVRTHYDPAVSLHLPGGQAAHGHAGVDRFVIGYLAAFPDARLMVDHVVTRADPGRPVRVALRWRLAGTHAGYGVFGHPSGARLLVPGITHVELVDGRVIREYVLVDELAIWTGIGRKRG